MMWLILSIVGSSLFCLFVLCSPLTIKMMYQFEGKRKHFAKVELFLFSIAIWRKQFNFMKQNKIKDEQLISNGLKFYQFWKLEKEYIKGKFTLQRLLWRTVIGTEEVISTSLIAAFFSMLKEVMASQAYQYIKVKETPVIEVIPFYEGAVFQEKVEMQGRLRFYHAFSIVRSLRKYF